LKFQTSLIIKDEIQGITLYANPGIMETIIKAKDVELKDLITDYITE